MKASILGDCCKADAGDLHKTAGVGGGFIIALFCRRQFNADEEVRALQRKDGLLVQRVSVRRTDPPLHRVEHFALKCDHVRMAKAAMEFCDGHGSCGGALAGAIRFPKDPVLQHGQILFVVRKSHGFDCVARFNRVQ